MLQKYNKFVWKKSFNSLQVPTVFWWDNFNRNVDIKAEGGSIHNTPRVVFQERTDSTKRSQWQYEMVKINRRSLIGKEEKPLLISALIS